LLPLTLPLRRCLLLAACGEKARVRGAAWVFLLIVTLCTSALAFAQDTEQRMTVLHLNQTAERTVIRDLLRIELRVEETGADARSVQAEINRRMAAARGKRKVCESRPAPTMSAKSGHRTPRRTGAAVSR